ncbi:MAG TPA: hypothetical protein VHW01_26625 [Polyangiaceae bacterium]|jgi:hypothetical protein|nr:hypothetical protein [Polyangiaceae bacterium]
MVQKDGVDRVVDGSGGSNYGLLKFEPSRLERIVIADLRARKQDGERAQFFVDVSSAGPRTRMAPSSIG